jgi:hypothetical protein
MPSIVLWKTVSTDRPGERVSIDSPEAVVGRSKTCDHMISQDLVSRRHLRIWLEGDRTWRVEDLGSMNGTFVNDERVKTTEIRPGDVIRMGPAGPSLRVLSLDPPPAGAKAVTEEIALHWMKRVTEKISSPSDSQGMSSIEIGAMADARVKHAPPAARASPPPPAARPPPATAGPPRREVAPEREPATVPTDEPEAPATSPPAARPAPPPAARRRSILRVLLVTLFGAALGFLLGLQLLSGVLPAEWVNAPALFLGMHLVKVGTALPVGLILPVLMAAYVAGLFASAQFPYRGWLVFLILILIHWGTGVLIRTDPETVKGLLEASVGMREEILTRLTGR